MALHNAFAEIITERTGRLLLQAVSYARDVNDRMRVVVDKQPSVTVAAGPYLMGSSTGGTARTWNDVNTAFVLDQRELWRQQSQIQAQQRRTRWTYS